MENRKQYLKQLKTLHKAFADTFDDGDTIYHYTSAEGLRGIIGTNEIWLTNTAFVNDTTECRALQEHTNLLDVSSTTTNQYVKNQWQLALMSHRSEHTSATQYIASFSRKGESLAQFRAYGHFCIGFEAKGLARSDYNLYNCVYSYSEIEAWIDEKAILPEWQGALLGDQAKRSAAFGLLYAATVKFKNENYRAEREVRLFTVSNHTWDYPNSPSMYIKDPPIHFRDHPVLRVPVPYVKFFLTKQQSKQDISEDPEESESEIEIKERKLHEERNMKRELLPITEIIIGPMAHQKEAELACKILLSEKDYQDVPVKVSAIPYRGF